MRDHRLVLAVFAAISLFAMAAAQEVGLAIPDVPTNSGAVAPPADLLLPPATGPVEPPPPQLVPPAPPPTWSWQQQSQNQAAAVTNLHQRTGTEDGNAYRYQHTVTNPSGSHTQLRQYEQSEEGYSRLNQQRFYRPDGTLLREHQMSVSGSDPYNYQRQMTHTFRDGRTMEQNFTRAYDGQSGTMTRSFTGPNGQVRQFERPWTPGDMEGVAPMVVDPAQLPTPEQVGLPTADTSRSDTPTVANTSPSAAAEETSLWNRLNPFRRRESGAKAVTTASNGGARRSGFTVGSLGRSRSMQSMPPGLARKSSSESTVRSMQASATSRQVAPPAHAMGPSRRSAGKPR